MKGQGRVLDLQNDVCRGFEAGKSKLSLDDETKDSVAGLQSQGVKMTGDEPEELDPLFLYLSLWQKVSILGNPNLSKIKLCRNFNYTDFWAIVQLQEKEKGH